MWSICIFHHQHSTFSPRYCTLSAVYGLSAQILPSSDSTTMPVYFSLALFVSVESVLMTTMILSSLATLSQSIRFSIASPTSSLVIALLSALVRVCVRLYFYHTSRQPCVPYASLYILLSLHSIVILVAQLPTLLLLRYRYPALY